MILRHIFTISTVISVLNSFALIGMGICEIILDQNKAGTEGDPSENIIVTHLFISLLMFCGCNIFILIHVIYITQYVLRGLRYHWHLSCHYFTYIVWEIISVCCVFGKFEYLQYPMALHILTATLFVCLFFFNCWAVQLFEILEDKCRAEEEVRNLMRKGVYGQRKIPCVRINLRPEGVNTGASTSGNVGSPSVASTTAKKTKPKK